MTSTIVFDLPDKPGAATEEQLSTFLRENHDRPVAICASALRRIETPLLQYLLVAAADWRTRGVTFAVTALSSEHRSLLDLAGVTQAMLSSTPDPDPEQGQAICH